MIHRRCKDHVRVLETELHEMQRREVDHTLVVADLRSRLDQADTVRWDDAGTVEVLRQKLTCADARERELRHEIHDLQCRINDLEERERTWEHQLSERRRRAAETALGSAWREPGAEWAARQAAVAQAILALPLEAFDVEVTYERNHWYVDGERFAHFLLPDIEQAQIQERYGLTDGEIAQIREAALRQEHDDEDTPVVI